MSASLFIYVIFIVASMAHLFLPPRLYCFASVPLRVILHLVVGLLNLIKAWLAPSPSSCNERSLLRPSGPGPAFGCVTWLPPVFPPSSSLNSRFVIHIFTLTFQNTSVTCTRPTLDPHVKFLSQSLSSESMQTGSLGSTQNGSLHCQ